MKKYKIQHHMNARPSKAEVNSGEIMLVPDDSYTIQEILDKFAKGIALNVDRETYFSDTEDFEEVDERSRIQDLTDISEADERISARQTRKKAEAEKRLKVSLQDSESAEKPEG